MKPGEKEIEWGLVAPDVFDGILLEAGVSQHFTSNRITFYNFPLQIGVTYDNPAYRDLLAEKFYVTNEWFSQVLPKMHFLRYQETFGFQLPFRNFGFVDMSNVQRSAVFASSFGVFKSVISGFASFCYESSGYYPIHGSVVTVDGRGVAFIGGSMAGKTTTLINIAHRMQRMGKVVQVLADDWCVVKWQEKNGLVAETFDPSVSFRKRDLEENPHITFPCQDWLLQQFQSRDKISLFPSVLYGESNHVNAVRIDYIVLLEPFPGPCILRRESNKEVFAEKIIHAAYHYPYLTKGQYDCHVKFWCAMQKEITTVCFYTRAQNGGCQSLDPIEEMLK